MRTGKRILSVRHQLCNTLCRIAHRPPSYHSFAFRDRSFLFKPSTLELKLLSGDPPRRITRRKEKPFNFDQEIRRVQASPENVPARTLITLHTSHACNMKCGYCLAGGGSYGRDAENMTVEVACQALDMLVRPPGTDIHFFGGEPMLNPDAIRASIKHALELGNTRHCAVRFFMSTNGTITLDSLADLIEGTNFQVNVSLDGPEEIHNLQRPLKCGGKSFKTVSENIGKWVKQFGPEKIHIKMTAPRGSDSLITLAETALSLSARNILITQTIPGGDCAVPSSEAEAAESLQYLSLLRDLYEWYLPLLNQTHYPRIQPLHKLMTLLYRGRGVRQRCMAGIRMFTVHPDGSIFPCYRLSDDPRYRIGTTTSGELSSDIGKQILQLGVNSDKQCGCCWIRHLCSGNKCLQQNLIRKQPLTAINSSHACVFREELFKMSAYYVSQLQPEICERTLWLPV